MKKDTNLSFVAFLFYLVVIIASCAYADDTQELKKQIEALQKRVDELESAQRQAQPTMPPADQGRWDPFAEMERIQEQMDAMFGQVFSGGANSPGGMFTTDMVFDQALDLKETDKGYEINFDMKGLDKEKMDIQINKNSITVSGQYSQQDTQENPNSVMQSSRFGTFLKTIPLPVDADTSKVNTQQKGDILVITIPKK